MDSRNALEALREAELDEQEGADMLMVKPALAYLDVIQAVRSTSTLPLSAYNVSGEYAAVKAAAANGWLDEANERCDGEPSERPNGWTRGTEGTNRADGRHASANAREGGRTESVERARAMK